MKLISLPLLLEDGTRLDWPEARYEPTVGVSLDKAKIHHRLLGAPSLHRAIKESNAKWAAELRCPKTLLSRIDLSSKENQTVRWTLDELDGDSWIIPGLVATREFDLQTEGLDSFWRGAPLRVPRGWWLVQGTKRRVKSLAQSLLQFKLDKKLGKGQMQVQSERGSGDLKFVAYIAPDIWPEIQTNRSLQVAALIGVCGNFREAFGEDAEEESSLARQIRNRLEENEAPVWTDPNFCPARAATTIENFHPTADNED